MKEFKGKLEGNEEIIVKKNGKRYKITTGDLLSNCVDRKFGETIVKMVKALELQFDAALEEVKK